MASGREFVFTGADAQMKFCAKACAPPRRRIVLAELPI